MEFVSPSSSSKFEEEFCKMAIRLIFFKEIVGVISLKTGI